jgi:hypothetical protein
MQLSDIVARFNIPWGNSAGVSYTHAIPQASQIGITPGAASLTDGFPPLNFLPVGGGGIPPFGQDFNGIFNWVTDAIQWIQAGGTWGYDSTFSAAINGYPQGAIVVAASGIGNFWLNLVDNNTSNPDTGGANWVPFSLGVPSPSAISAAITLGSAQTLTNNLATTINLAGTLPFATVSGGVATFTKAGRYTFNSTMRTTVVTAGAGATYGDPHIYLNGVEQTVASASVYVAGAVTQLLAGSTSWNGYLNVGDQVSVVGQCGVLAPGGAPTSISVTSASLYIMKEA